MKIQYKDKEKANVKHKIHVRYNSNLVLLTVDPRGQDIHLTVDIDSPVRNLNDPWKDIVYRSHQILVMCSNFL